MFKKYFKVLSGNDIKELLNIYLLFREGQQITNQIDLYYKNKSINIINNIKELHKIISKNNKYKILSLISNYYTKKELLDMGFEFSSGQFTKSRKSNNNNNLL